MFRKFYSSFFFLILLVIVSLAVSSSNVRAEEKGADLRGSAEVLTTCVVPYNINGYGFRTGIHIVTSSAASKHITIYFFCGGRAYAVKDIIVPPEGWTGLVTDLLPNGVSFRAPTLLYFDYYKDPNSNWTGKFWVTQFLFTGYGFSHQVFTSAKP